MLIFQIKRTVSSEKWFNYVVTFFFENAKNLGRSDDAKRRKKEDGLVTTNVKFFQSWGRLSRLELGKLNCGILHSSGETTFKFIKFIKDVGNCPERSVIVSS